MNMILQLQIRSNKHKIEGANMSEKLRNLGFYNGKYDLIENMNVPMSDRVCWFGDGVYDATATRNGLHVHSPV